MVLASSEGKRSPLYLDEGDSNPSFRFYERWSVPNSPPLPGRSPVANATPSCGVRSGPSARSALGLSSCSPKARALSEALLGFSTSQPKLLNQHIPKRGETPGGGPVLRFPLLRGPSRLGGSLRLRAGSCVMFCPDSCDVLGGSVGLQHLVFHRLLLPSP